MYVAYYDGRPYGWDGWYFAVMENVVFTYSRCVWLVPGSIDPLDP